MQILNITSYNPVGHNLTGKPAALAHTSMMSLGVVLTGLSIKDVLHRIPVDYNVTVGTGITGITIKDAVRHRTSLYESMSVGVAVREVVISRDDKPPTVHKFNYDSSVRVGATVTSLVYTFNAGRININADMHVDVGVAVTDITIK